MFLRATLQQNPNLIQAAVEFHQEGKIYPNTYLLDTDRISQNAQLLARAAKENGISLYMMTKQIGRNPVVANMIAAAGIEKAVAVDPWEALTLAEAGISLGNVGHLVQIPRHMIPKILSYRPEVITVFSPEKAEEIGREAVKQGRVQDILLKIVGEKDMVYEGQQGGIETGRLLQEAARILKMPGVRIAGCTVFPCLLFNPHSRTIEKTENADTLLRSVQLLQRELGIKILQVNGPSATSVASIPLLKKLGITHGEPGHALTGTTPLHADSKQPEIPSMVYVSEISHLFEGKAYAYGGGHYSRSNATGALVGKSFEEMKDHFFEIEPIPPENIDYYGIIKTNQRQASVGDTVVYGYRTQIFTTRSQVALIEGIQAGKPKLIGVYDSLGKKLK